MLIKEIWFYQGRLIWIERPRRVRDLLLNYCPSKSKVIIENQLESNKMIFINCSLTSLCYSGITVHQMAAQGELNMLKQEVENGGFSPCAI
jgi:hypothetical protein